MCTFSDHTFIWTSISTHSDQPSGWCQCGQQYYDAGQRMIYYPANYNPYGPHAQPPLPPNAIPIANYKAAKLLPDATHISPDGTRVYVKDGERVHYWDEENRNYGSSWECDGLPEDVIKL